MAKNLKLKSLFVPCEPTVGVEAKPAVEGGRIKRIIGVYKRDFNQLFRANLYFIIFIAPLFVLLLYGLPALMQHLGSNLNFMSEVGVGYQPSGTNALSEGLSILYTVYQYFMLLFVAAVAIISIGASGLFYVTKRCWYDEDMKKITKPFFYGVKKNCLKTMAAMTFGALVVLAIASETLYQLTLVSTGCATAGHWVLIVVTYLIGVPLLLVPVAMLPMIARYEDMSFAALIRNSVGTIINHPISVIITLVLTAVPVIIVPFSSTFSYIIYIVVVMFGFPLWSLGWTSCGSYICDNTLGRMALEKKAAEAEAAPIYGTVAKKKPAKKAPKPYVNPKKNKNKKK